MYITEERLRQIIREELQAALRPADEEPMGVQELADHLGLSAYTVSRKAITGDLPAFKVGKTWRFYLSDVRAALTAPSVIDPWQRSPRSVAAHKAAATRKRNGNL
ncbi:helix-turn-helix domain-containing protein [Leifsonia poae]|uniref:helix-turn-helix domain-containing protein n=1 Tax=Leifsonia poae TaxID=110933 RepID=UPI003D685ACF